MTDKTLFSTVNVGDIRLPNRIAMAPMVRNRASADYVPGELMATYYRQRAGAGLLITGMTVVSPQGDGYLYVPGLFTDEQVAGWRLTTEAVHEQGGRIFVQLGHAGRLNDISLNEGKPPVAPSAIRFEGDMYTYNGVFSCSQPRALETDEIPDIVKQFRDAVVRACAAGFDGVELHSANGYMLDQFLRSSTNQRTDEYGGSSEKRARFVLEVVAAAIEAWDSKRIGIRLSPSDSFNDMHDDTPFETYRYLIEQLNSFNIAYVHLVGYDDEMLAMVRSTFNGTLIVNGGFNKERGNAILAEGKADLVAFGMSYLSNPDLTIRLKLDAPLNAPDHDTFYIGGAKGYIDYPTLAQAG